MVAEADTAVKVVSTGLKVTAKIFGGFAGVMFP
jgi:hypothetical protein